jgi:hypothetical protein
VTEILKTISDGIAGLSGTALSYAGALAIAGTLAMAILQIIKELTPLRRAYQRRWLGHWLAQRADSFLVAAQLGPAKIDSALLTPDRFTGEKAQAALVELATGGEANAFYDLTIEQVVAQMNAAAQVALEYPQLHFTLLAVLSQGADVEDVRKLLPPARGARKPDPGALDARNRVGHRIQRNLDGIQIALGSRWRLWMQATSIVFTIAFVELAIIENVKGYTGATLLVGAVLGVVGGYLAPITRDVVAALQSLRKA